MVEKRRLFGFTIKNHKSHEGLLLNFRVDSRGEEFFSEGRPKTHILTRVATSRRLCLIKAICQKDPKEKGRDEKKNKDFLKFSPLVGDVEAKTGDQNAAICDKSVIFLFCKIFDRISLW